jgi:cobalamin biosynthesis protein CobT
MKLTGDLSAKLLATENITVVRSRVRTASFDIKSRVLTLPNWKDMTPEIDDMLRGHEVGHALFTDESYIEPIMENRKIASYLNVIEDVRIEKLLKRKYPGIRKSMNEGYRQLNEKDFFGVSKIPNLEVLNLIDRINLYYKAGYSCGVTFSSEEKLFVARAEKTETVDEVIALANDIYAFSKEQAEKRRKEAQENPEDLELLEEEAGDDAEDYDDDFDDYEVSDEDDGDADAQEPDDQKQAGSGRSKQSKEEREEEKSAREEQEIEKELESQTEKNFTEKLEELADENTEYRY